jgi:Ca-activated chloride channel family protein
MSNSPVPAEVKFAMMVLVDESASPLPLEHTQVNAHLTGLIATVTVNQSFINSGEEPVELEYLFPLPENAAIVDFSIRIGSRLIRGDVRESGQAREAYEQARQGGMHAALLEQRRPNLFAVRIANVLPHEPIQTSLQYEERLTMHPGELEFVFPMGITPKYHAAGHPEEATGVQPPFNAQAEKIGKVDIQLTADLGMEIGTPISPSHTLIVENLALGQLAVRLDEETLPDHDFVLRLPLAGKPVEVTAWCARDANGGETVLANWLPGLPEPLEIPQTALPREFIFVLDRSGSMSGEPIRQARNALRACLRILEAQDVFRILLFDDYLEWYQEDVVEIAQTTIDRADAFLSRVEGRGGTEILEALDSVLSLPAKTGRTRHIVFLTDGAVSAEERALNFVRQKLNQARVFTFGIGPSVNRALLTRMAQLGRGTAEFLQLEEDIEGAILRFQDRVAFPVLTDIQIEWGHCKAWDIYPALLPDLYAGQTLQMAARIQRNAGGSPAYLRVKGRRGSEVIKMEVALPEAERDSPEVTRAWARARVDELLEQSAVQSGQAHKARQEIISLAQEHHLITPFTAFVAVDQDVVNSGGRQITLAIAQPLPKGLERNGFLPPVNASPASPKMMPDSSIQMKAMRYETGAVPPPMSAELPPAVGEGSPLLIQSQDGAMNFFSKRIQREGLPGQESDPADANFSLERPDQIFHWLARSQNMDGSWPQGIEFTAAALLAFVRGGHTHKRGHYRKLVQRAADWLARISAEGTPAYAQVLALFELAQIENDATLQTAAQAIVRALPAPTGAFEQAVIASYRSDSKVTRSPQRIARPEDIRVAAACHLQLAVPPELISGDPTHLALIWALSLR